jgi:hypothetical protein
MYKLLLHFIIFTCLLGLTGCGKNFFKRADVKDVPINVEERVQKNLEEGKGIRFGKFGKSSGGTFDFASSNELWRATVDTLDFVPLINASYSGGIIITDWFNGGSNNNDDGRDLKITVKFLSNDIRSDALDVDVHERICNAQKINCTVSLIDSKISNDIKIAILKKAAFFEKNKVEKIIKENRKKRPKPVKSE